MRIFILAALVVSGCASSQTPSTSAAEIERLDRECTARGGILVPTGRITGYEARDNVCKINGGATTIPPKT